MLLSYSKLCKVLEFIKRTLTHNRVKYSTNYDTASHSHNIIINNILLCVAYYTIRQYYYFR